MHNFQGCHTSYFKGDIHGHVSSSTPFLYNMEKPKYKETNMRYHITRHKVVQYLKVLKSDLVLPISRLPDIAQK